MNSCPVGAVRDLHRSSLPVAGGRPRTNTNETEIETTRGSSAGGAELWSGHLRSLWASTWRAAETGALGA
jgi:hypothetical protein